MHEVGTEGAEVQELRQKLTMAAEELETQVDTKFWKFMTITESLLLGKIYPVSRYFNTWLL